MVFRLKLGIFCRFPMFFVAGGDFLCPEPFSGHSHAGKDPQAPPQPKKSIPIHGCVECRFPPVHAIVQLFGLALVSRLPGVVWLRTCRQKALQKAAGVSNLHDTLSQNGYGTHLFFLAGVNSAAATQTGLCKALDKPRGLFEAAEALGACVLCVFGFCFVSVCVCVCACVFCVFGFFWGSGPGK